MMPDYLSSLIRRSRRPAENLVPPPRVLFEPWVAGSPAGEQAGGEPDGGAVALPSRAFAAGEPELAGRLGRVDATPRPAPGSGSAGSPSEDPEAAISAPPSGQLAGPSTRVRPVLEPELPDRPGALLPRPAPEFRPPVESTGPERGDAQPSAVPGPVIRVTIGRLEVQAILPPSPPADSGRGDRHTPGLSLDDYLKQRRGGER